MPAAEVTWPYVPDPRVVSTPEYWTVLKTLLAVARISKVRVSEKRTVLESDAFTETVPGPGIE